MRIAVTYDNGNVFQHFGRTENFKIYDIEDEKIVGTQVIGNNGIGHEALAEYLAAQGVNVIICGGMGGGAQMALSEAGIEICAGAAGDADAAVEAYLKGELEDSGVNCDHHEHEQEEEGECGCGGGCCGGDDEEGGCGGCCGGCGGGRPAIEGKNVGMTVRVHYEGTLNDGSKFDSSYDRGEPLEFMCGAGMMIRGFDQAVANMEVGDVVNVHLMPEEAYGEADPGAIFTLKIAQLPGSEGLEVNERVVLRNMYGQPIPVKVVDKTEEDITFDANHEMAGKELNFKIELVEIK